MEKQLKIPKLRFPEFEGAWEKKRIGDIGTIVTGSTPPTANDQYYNGTYQFVSPFDINEKRFIEQTKTTLTKLGFDKGRKIRIGSSLFVCIGSTIGKVAQNKVECISNQQINAVVPNHNFSDDFIYSVLEKHSLKIKMLAGEQAVPLINKSTFSNYSLKLPSLAEQFKISSFLLACDEYLIQMKKKKSLLEQYKKGMMQQLFFQELRFKDEDGNDFADWEEVILGDISHRITRKNKENNLNVLTISAQNGLINQEEYFKKSVSSKDVSGYYLMFNDDFAYNKSYSAGYPMGAIKRLKRYEKGVVSTLYICFRFSNSIDFTFMEKYFESGLHNTEIEKVAQEGARNHGLLNIGVSDFFNTNLILPSLPEQQKIASFLSALDDKIAQTALQIEKMQLWKKGLLQQMFA